MIDLTGNTAVDHDQIFTCNPCVDFIYDERKRSMKMRAHYSKFLAQNEIISASLSLNNGKLLQHMVQRQMCTIEPGTLFIHNGSLVEVISINENNVVVRDDETLDCFNIDVNEAAT